MPAAEKLSISLPQDLVEVLSRKADAADGNRSAFVAEIIRAGLSARTQIDQLHREIADLKKQVATSEARLAAAETKAKPPPDFRDFLTGSKAGTSRLRRDLEWAERARKQAEADAAEARRDAQSLRAEVAELEAAAEAQAEAIATLEEERDEAIERCEAAERELAAEKARKVPWRFRVPVPWFRWTVLPATYRKPDPASWRRGFLACALLVGLGLFLLPHDGSTMRYVASAAMGTWGDMPKAAARLHGGPMMGQDTLLQIYSLFRAADNPNRLETCFRRAAKLKPGQRPIDCTIKVPSEFALYADVMMSGPDAHTSRLKRQLERQRQIEERWDREMR